MSFTANDGGFPLYAASQKGHVAVARELLNRGAAVDARNTENTTPLIIACVAGHLEVAKLLISRAANVNAADAFGSALEGAVDHAKIAALLRRRGAV